MTERVLIQNVNKATLISREQRNLDVLYKSCEDNKLKVGVKSIYFSDDCFDVLLDLCSADLVENKALNLNPFFDYLKIGDQIITNIPTLLGDIFFNRSDYQVKRVNIKGNINKYSPNQIVFKDCAFINKLQCNLYLRNISTNEVFNPSFFKVELLFTTDPAVYNIGEI